MSDPDSSPRCQESGASPTRSSVDTVIVSAPLEPAVPVPPNVFTPITKDFGFLPIPKHLRHDPEHPAHFGLLLNATFGFSGTFVLANLYYCQPLLIQFSHTFDTSYDTVSRIPTLIQVGYAVGLLGVSTLGDLVRRRPLIIMLVFVCASLSIGLATTTNFAVFEALCFLIGVFTVVPQILLPLVADLAPPERRASAMSIVMSGLLLGILVARVLAGIIAQFASWRVVYYLAIGVQYLVVLWLYLVLPDYPAKNKGATYFGLLWGMFKFAVTEPQLVQAILISIPSAACYTNFWVTLTFLLGGPPYDYSTLVIGIFGVVGIVGVAMAPPLGRLIDSLVPWFASILAIVGYLLTHVIMVAADGINIGPVVIVCIGIDIFRQMLQVSLTTAVFSLDASARSRMNACILISIFLGQIMGTSVGTKVFVQYGWRPAAALNLGWSGLMLIFMLMRGPHVPRYTWLGWKGGLEIRKGRLAAQQKREEMADIAAADSPYEEKDSKRDSTGDKLGTEKVPGEKVLERAVTASPLEQTDTQATENDPSAIV